MPESQMTDVIASKPHLFGLSKIADADTLRQAMGGWWPGIDTSLRQRILAGVDANGDGFLAQEENLDVLAFPVHVINAVILPASAIKPAADAKPYQR